MARAFAFDPTADNDSKENERLRYRLAKEQQEIEALEAEEQEHPIEDESDEIPERRLLKRELEAQALKRMEDSARTAKDFENIVAWWDRLDANRRRKERYHELLRSGDALPLDYGASVNEIRFPSHLHGALEKQIQQGDYLDAIFYCPYEIHELVTDESLSVILQELNEDHKFLLFLSALQRYNSAQIAVIREQSDRNIRKVRNTLFKKIRKKLLAAVNEKVQKQQPLTLQEKQFLNANPIDVEIE